MGEVMDLMGPVDESQDIGEINLTEEQLIE